MIERDNHALVVAWSGRRGAWASAFRYSERWEVPLRRTLLALAAAVLAWWWWPRATPPVGSTAPAPRSGWLRWPQSAPTGPSCAERIAAARAELARVQAAVGELPHPFSDGRPREAHEAEARAELAEIQGANPDLQIGRLDCAEDPCLVFFAGNAAPLQTLSPLGTWQAVWGLSETSVFTDDRDPVFWQVAAQIVPGHPVPMFAAAADDPAQVRRIHRRVDGAIDALAADAGGWRPSPRELAERKLAAVDATPDEPSLDRVRAQAERDLARAVAVEAARTVAPPEPEPPPSGCGPELDAIEAERARLARDAALTPAQPPPDLDPAWTTEAFAARLAQSLAECPEVAEQWVATDCAEWPCVVLWRGGRPPDVDGCPPFAAVPHDAGMGTQTMTYTGPDGPQQLSAVIWRPPGWYGSVDADLEPRERVRARMDALMIDGRDDLGLRAMTALEFAENTLRHAEQRAPQIPDEHRASFEQALEVQRAEVEQLRALAQ